MQWSRNGLLDSVVVKKTALFQLHEMLLYHRNSPVVKEKMPRREYTEMNVGGGGSRMGVTENF